MSSAGKKRKLNRGNEELEKLRREIKKYAEDINLGKEEGLFGEEDILKGNSSRASVIVLYSRK